MKKNVGEFLSNLFPEKKEQRINELIEIVELEEFAQTKVKYLSGGQKQRVALARALAKEPEVLLLDEPFSHIDNLKKQSLRRSLFGYLKQNEITSIIATHDKDDIISFADNLLFLYQGKTIAYGSPEALYHHPKNRLVASFFDEFNEFVISEFTNSTQFGTFIVYPHQIKIVEKSNYHATVKRSYFRGDHYLIKCLYKDTKLYIKHPQFLDSRTEIYFKIDDEILKELNKDQLKALN